MHSWFFRSKLKFSAPWTLDSNLLKSDPLQVENLTGQHGPDQDVMSKVNALLANISKLLFFK
jgi:hypothetical protein